MVKDKTMEMKRYDRQSGNVLDAYMAEKQFSAIDLFKLVVDTDGEKFKKHHKDVMEKIFEYLIHADNPLEAIDKIRLDMVTQRTGTLWLSFREPCTHWKWLWTSQGEIAVIFHKATIDRDDSEYMEFPDSFIDAFAENLGRFCNRLHLPGYVIITDGVLRKAA